MKTDSPGFKAQSMSRRAFLRIGSTGFTGLTLAAALERSSSAHAAEPTPSAKNVIMIFLTGGPATIDMWDMKPEAPDSTRGEFRPRRTSLAGVQICEHMPALAEKMQRVTLVRSLSHTIAEHSEGTAYVMAGNRPSPSINYPSLGSLSAALLPSSTGMPPFATIGAVPSAGAGDLGSALNPFEISGVAKSREQPVQASPVGLPAGFSIDDLRRRERVLARFDERMRRLDSSDLPHELDRFQQQALDILRSDKINKALDVSMETSTVRDSFGASPLGHNLLASRRLIEAGARFVTVGYGDWDTHANNFTRLRNTLLPELDRGLAALIADLEQRGLLRETIIYCTGEFGRTPTVNTGGGRDHWARSMSCLLAGGGMKSGCVFGATDAHGQEPTDDPCSPDDISATIFHQLGFQPNHQVATRQGRPIFLFRDGRVLSELISTHHG